MGRYDWLGVGLKLLGVYFGVTGAAGVWHALLVLMAASGHGLRVEGVGADQKTLTFDDDISDYHSSANAVVRRVVTYLSQLDLPKPPFSVQPGGDPDAVAELQPSSFFSRRAWEQAGPIDESLTYAFDCGDGAGTGGGGGQSWSSG